MPSWSGGWDNMFGQPYALLNEPSAAARGVARIMFPTAQRDVGAAEVALNGAVVGGNATATQAYVTSIQADGLNQGGQRPVGPVTLINRVTTAADIAKLNQQYQPTFAPTTYPVDKSGNGGGSKVGTIN